MNIKRFNSAIAVSVLVVFAFTATASAANTPDLTQSITAGTLSTDILDNNRASVALPSSALSSKSFSFNCQSGGSASTGLLGTNTQRLYVINPDGADNGWNLSIAATGGATSVWENTGATQTFDFNDAGGSGCTDSGGADVDTRPGQLTIDPSVATLTADCISCTTANTTLGSSSAFNQGTTDSILLLNAAAGSNDVWRGYLTDINLSQTIPAEQAVDNYDINFTVTVTAS
jgi:hypothetical protein